MKVVQYRGVRSFTILLCNNRFTNYRTFAKPVEIRKIFIVKNFIFIEGYTLYNVPGIDRICVSTSQSINSEQI